MIEATATQSTKDAFAAARAERSAAFVDLFKWIWRGTEAQPKQVHPTAAASVC